MKVTLLWALSFAAEFALARPAPDETGDLLALNDGFQIAAGAAECQVDAPVGNTLFGVCSTEKQAGRVLYRPVTCPLGQCSVPEPRCDTGEGIGMGYCMDATSTCSPKDSVNGRPARPGKINGKWCYQEGIPCCDGVVTNVVSSTSLGLPSQFIDAILPPSSSGDEQLLSNNNLDLFSSTTDFTNDDGGSVQYSLLPGTGTGTGLSENLFASNAGEGFTGGGGDFVAQDDLLAANGDVSWFQG